MKRKIAAILAADAVGYSRLVAEDEEDTLARLASYRGVFGDFVNRFGGRIFNTAGDAILAEFESAVDAVRCAVDVQESLRARNLAYTPSRQMSFRIGITIGDVVERDGDLLGDGVNVAARLESVAPDGGICISRSVYEVVANKVSLEFSDRGEQHLKNIPDPVHAYTFAPDVSSKNRKQASRLASLVTRHWTVFAAVMVVLAGIAGFMFVGREQSVQSVKPPPAPATEASLPSEVEPDVESADSSSPPAEGTSAPPPAARAPQASTVSIDLDQHCKKAHGPDAFPTVRRTDGNPMCAVRTDGGLGLTQFVIDTSSLCGGGSARTEGTKLKCSRESSGASPKGGGPGRRGTAQGDGSATPASGDPSTKGNKITSDGTNPEGTTSNGASRDTAESPAQEIDTNRLEPDDLASSNCADLWYRRNSIFKEAGYCFKTRRAIKAFGNEGCLYDRQNDVPLLETDRQNINLIQRSEKSKRCQR